MNEPLRRTDTEFASLLGPLSETDDSWLALVQTAEAPAGDRFIGDYEILEEIRHGGQALVFRARHAQTGREVALKRTAYGAFASETERRRFEREVDAVLLLQHPGIVTVYGIDNVGGVDLLAMEWVEGQRLDTWANACIGDAGGLQRKLDAFVQICEAVQHAHQRGVIHRDLKPSNILVDASGRCRVLDFGLARRVTAASSEEDLTQTLGFVGTPAYAAPEHFATGRTQTDQRSDVYALGVILYQLLTGELPFAGEHLGGLIEAIQQRPHKPMSSLVSGLDRDLDAIVATAIAKQPADRYATVDALCQDLHRHLAGQPIQAVRPSLRYLTSKWIRRHRVAFSFSLVLVLLATATLALGIWQAGVIRDERDTANRQSQLAKKARNAAIDERSKADEARQRAETEADKARAVADFYLDLIKDALPASPTGTVDFFETLKKACAGAREHFAPHDHWALEFEANMAHTLASRGRHEESLRLARSALDLQRTLDQPVATTTGLLLRVIGETLAGQGKREEALPYLEEALAVYRSSPTPIPKTLSATLYTMGRTLTGLDRDEAAIPFFEEGLELATAVGAHDNAIACRSGMASALIGLGRAAEAERMLRACLNEASNPDLPQTSQRDTTLWTINCSLGTALSRQGSPDKAIPVLEEALAIARRIMTESHPELALSHLRVAQAQHESGRAADAVPNFERALQLGLGKREQALAHENVAFCYHETKQPEKACEHSEKACPLIVEFEPPSSTRRVVSYVNWLSALGGAKRYERARPLLSEALTQLKLCAEHGGCPPPGAWQQLFRISRFFSQLDATLATFDETLAMLDEGPLANSAEAQAVHKMVDSLRATPGSSAKKK